MKTRPHLVKRALALLLALSTLLSLLSVGASAASIEDGSRTAAMTLGKGQFYLHTTAGTALGAWSYTYNTDDGLSGPAYCIDHGLHFTDRTLPIDGKYTSSPKTAGVYANGYPQHSLDTFLGLYLAKNPILSGLTEAEYAYATQLAVLRLFRHHLRAGQRLPFFKLAVLLAGDPAALGLCAASLRGRTAAGAGKLLPR